MPNDWLPKGEQDLADLDENWKKELEDQTKVSAFGWKSDEVNLVLGKINGFFTARAAYKADDSTTNRLVKNEAKEEAIDAMRDFANSSIRFNKNMNDAQRLVFGIRPKDTTQSAHPVPTSQPETVVENTVNHFEHRVRALNRGRNDSSKPEDAYGVRYAWQVGGDKPASGNALPKSKFSRKTSFVITHSEADKAKPAYYATCYENSKGEEGPWSPIEESTIG